jgi:hypothetical protein
LSLLFYIFSLLTMQMKLLNLVFSSIIVQFLLHQTGHCIHFVCMYFPLLLNHNFLDRNLLNFFRIYIHHNFINRDKTSKRNKHSRKVKFICRYTLDILKYLQCNKANAEKFQNIFMWNALILVLVEMPKFQFHVAFNN